VSYKPFVHNEWIKLPGEVGNFVAFWQLYAIYSALLRGVNAFDQPSVEASKLISFNKRLQFKGL
jgi:glucose-6-phosphate isomerase